METSEHSEMAIKKLGRPAMPSAPLFVRTLAKIADINFSYASYAEDLGISRQGVFCWLDDGCKNADRRREIVEIVKDRIQRLNRLVRELEALA